MAQHWWTAEDYADGAVPSDAWSPLKNITSYTIQTDTSGAKYLEIVHPSLTRAAIEFLPSVDVESSELLAEFSVGQSNVVDVGFYCRGTGLSGANEFAVRADFAESNNRISQYVDGEFTTLNSVVNSLTADARHFFRFRAFANDARLRNWPAASSEPSTWGLQAETIVGSTGKSGLVLYNPGGLRVYSFGVGSGGDPAPVGPVTAVPTPINLSVSAMTETEATLNWEAGS